MDLAELTTVKQPRRIPKAKFAYIDSRAEEHLPIHDESHVPKRDGAFQPDEFESESAKESARRKIIAAAKRHGMEISPEDEIRKRTTSLRPARTKREPRGGKKVVRPKRHTTARQRTAARRNIKKAKRAALAKVRARWR